jgi:hypothetical protein
MDIQSELNVIEGIAEEARGYHLRLRQKDWGGDSEAWLKAHVQSCLTSIARIATEASRSMELLQK